MARPKPIPKIAQQRVEEAVINGEPICGEIVAEEMKSLGYDTSKSAVYRHAVRFREKVQATKDAVDRAKILAAAVDNAPGALSEAVVAMVQTELFDVLVEIEKSADEDDPEKRLKILSMAANTISDLTRASTALRKYQEEVRASLASASASAEQIAMNRGMTVETWTEIRREFLGILPP